MFHFSRVREGCFPRLQLAQEKSGLRITDAELSNPVAKTDRLGISFVLRIV